MKYWHRYFPWLQLVSPATLRADLLAALTGAALVIPQGIAFAAIAGLPPEYGFYCAMVAPIIAALCGSSWHMVSGPTTAISALLFATLQESFAVGSPAYIEAAITLTLMAGVIQIALGLARLGNLSNFISHAVMVGFITGAALLIILSQITHLLQAPLPRPEQMLSYAKQLPAALAAANHYALLIGALTLITALAVKRYLPAAPHYLLALVAGTLLGYYLDAGNKGVALVGELTEVIPIAVLPTLSWPLLQQLAPGAVALALVGLLEAVAIARALSLKSGQDIDTNREFIGQGLSNLGGSLLSSYMSSGSFTRSGVNLESGAKTPLAVVFTSLFLFLILLFIAPLFAYLPIPAMATVIMLVGWRLLALQEFIHYARTSQSELAIALTALLGTLFISLEFGLYAGIMLALALFINKTAKPNVRLLAPLQTDQGRYFHNLERFNLPSCPQINFIRLDGPLYFGSVAYLTQQLRAIQHSQANATHWVFLCRGIALLDMQAAQALRDLFRQKRASGGDVHLVIRYVWQLESFRRFGLLDEVGAQNIYPAKGIAIKTLVPRLNQDRCRSCAKRIFAECPPPPHAP